jgi:hypothetical protein
MDRTEVIAAREKSCLSGFPSRLEIICRAACRRRECGSTAVSEEHRRMSSTQPATRQKFFVEIIKPSHYDDDGYVIQWLRAFIPSTSLGAVHSLATDAKLRQVLGENVDIKVTAYDECHTVIPTGRSSSASSSMAGADWC